MEIRSTTSLLAFVTISSFLFQFGSTFSLVRKLWKNGGHAKIVTDDCLQSIRRRYVRHNDYSFPRRMLLPVYSATKAIIIVPPRDINPNNAEGVECLKPEIQRINDSNKFRSVDCDDNEHRQYDMSSPREWLEYSPTGSYTVVRCECFPSTNNVTVTTKVPLSSSLDSKNYNNSKNEYYSWIYSSSGWLKIWGIEYHTKRLVDSYSTSSRSGIDHDNDDVQSYTTRAKNETIYFIRTLLDHAHILLDPDASFSSAVDNDVSKSHILMLTILWHSSNNGTITAVSDMSNTIHVTCHLCRSKSSLPTSSFYPPKSVVGIATPSILFPNRRWDHPSVKQTSWCQKRRPIEMAFMGRKDIGIDEVLLTEETITSCSPIASYDSSNSTSNNNTDVILLEGLTTNLFCVYKPDNIIRTTTNTQQVLNGFVQHIVIDAAKRLGYKVDTETPICINDSFLWKEVFLTSSIKLMVGVKTIYVPQIAIENVVSSTWSLNNTMTNGDGTTNIHISSFTKVWEDTVVNSPTTRNNKGTIDKSVMQQIYDFILK